MEVQSNNNLYKQIVVEFLSFLQYKVENDLLTIGELEALAKVINERMILLGTIDDFAKFYDQTRDSVRSAISRRMVEKPVRRVFYSFNAFRKIVPDRWRKNQSIYKTFRKEKEAGNEVSK